MTTAVLIVEGIVSAKDVEAVIVMAVVGTVEGRMVAVIVTEAGLVVAEMVVVGVGGPMVAVTETAVARLVVTMDPVVPSVVVGMTEGRMVEVAAMVIVVVEMAGEIHMVIVVVVMVVAEVEVVDLMVVVVVVEVEVVDVELLSAVGQSTHRPSRTLQLPYFFSSLASASRRQSTCTVTTCHRFQTCGALFCLYTCIYSLLHTPYTQSSSTAERQQSLQCVKHITV